MCRYFSCIVTPDKKVHYSLRTNSHDELMEELGIREKNNYEGLAVKIEVTPATHKITRDIKDWILKVDDDTPEPDWYWNNRAKIEASIWEAWQKSIAVQLAIDTEFLTADNIIAYAYDKAHITAQGTAKIEAYDSARVIAYDTARVTAYDTAQVIAGDSTRVQAYQNTTVRAKNTAIVKAEDTAKITAYHNTHIKAIGHAHVDVYDDATVLLGCLATAKICGFGVTVRKKGVIYVLPGTRVVQASEVN